jgi:dipeptidyl-peptidase 9
LLISPSGQEEQLTFSHKGQGTKVSADPISSGLPSYIIQEEFNRFHGFWWQPVCRGKNLIA